MALTDAIRNKVREIGNHAKAHLDNNPEARQVYETTHKALNNVMTNISDSVPEIYSEITGKNTAEKANEWTQAFLNQQMKFNAEQAAEANRMQWAMLDAQMRYNSAERAISNQFSEHMWNETAGFNSAQAEAARQYSAAEAQKDREWQEYMSSTAHQREMADLQAAGLNPILAVNNGANMGTGAMGQIATGSTGAISGQGANASLQSAHAATMGALQGLMENSSNALALFGGLGKGLLSLLKLAIK